MKKRTAETLIEICVAMTIFGIVSAGVFDFMANQTLAIARIKSNDVMMYSAQKWINDRGYMTTDVESYDNELGVSRVWNKDDGTLTLSKSGNVITIKL